MHYIPLTQDYKELYSILYYYFGQPGSKVGAHDEELKSIGHQGRAWVNEFGTWDIHLVGQGHDTWCLAQQLTPCDVSSLPELYVQAGFGMGQDHGR